MVRRHESLRDWLAVEAVSGRSSAAKRPGATSGQQLRWPSGPGATCARSRWKPWGEEDAARACLLLGRPEGIAGVCARGIRLEQWERPTKEKCAETLADNDACQWVRRNRIKRQKRPR